MGYNIHPIPVKLNCFILTKNAIHSIYSLLPDLLSSFLSSSHGPCCLRLERWAPLNPVPLCYMSPKKVTFLKNSSPLLTVLWAAVCWQVPIRITANSHLTDLLSYLRLLTSLPWATKATLSCFVFPGPNPHLQTPHWKLTRCGWAVGTAQSAFWGKNL